MAALLAGGAAVAAGGLVAALNAAPGSVNLPRRGPGAGAFEGLILAFLQAGGDLNDIIVKRGKGQGKRQRTLKDGSTVRKSETFKFGGDRIAFGGNARNIIKKQLEKAQGEAVGQTQKNFDLIFGPDGPQFIKDRITDRPQQLREAFGPAVSQGLRAAIGGAAPAGTLTTDAVLQRVGAPLAFQAETLFQGAEDQRNAQQLGLSGVPGFGSGFGANPNNFTQPQGLQFLQGLGLQNFQAGQFGPALAAGQSRQQSQGFKSGLIGSSTGGFAGLFGGAA